MKNKFLLLIALLPFTIKAQNQNFTIRGKLKNVEYPAKVYMIYTVNGRLLKDSSIVNNDSFTLKGTVHEPTKAFLALMTKGAGLYSAPAPDQVGVYLENGTITVSSNGPLAQAKIGGTKLNKDQQDLMDVIRPFSIKEKELNAAYTSANGNDELLVKIKSEYDELAIKKEKAQIAFIKGHPASVVSLNLIRSSFNPVSDPPKSRMLIGLLSKDLQENKAAKRFLEGVKVVKKLEIGDMAPQFSMNNIKDEKISISSYQGKYLLLDFWASWCVPCRKENPNVIKAFNTFKDKNFDILGVSIDAGENGKKAWIEAIKQDGLTWEQVCDLKGSGNEAAILYQVDAIPTNFLIDPTGKIIAKNLRGMELETKLNEVLSKSN